MEFFAEMSKLGGCTDDKNFVGYLKVPVHGASCLLNRAAELLNTI